MDKQQPRQFKLSINRQAQLQAKLDLNVAFASAMMAWAGIERSLYYWFASVTGMRDGMARAIYYSARSFAARAEMIESSIEYAFQQSPAEIEFLKETLKKARQYSEFRNRMAHGEPMMMITDNPDVVSYQITQGKNIERHKDTAVTITDMGTAIENFYTLSNCTRDAIPRFRRRDPNAKSLQECLAIVRALPNQASAKSVPNSATPETPSQDRPHRNKKAYRAGRKIQKPE
jgi:hypothetical protein